jgi:ubiquinone/menaquinone biosynthesis C-methylase UbiE
MSEEKLIKPFSFKDFSDLDHSTDMGYLVASMDRMFEVDTIKNVKSRAIDLLNLQSGDAAIEVGCGLGHDSEEMGKKVGSGGCVIAIDSSKAMLEEAQKRSTQPQVKYTFGYSNCIDYPDCSFAASYADRLLVSQKDVEKTFSELVRVTKKGGTICITDIDVGSAIMYPNIPKLTNILLSRLQEIIQNPHIGRELHILFKKFGITNVKVISDAYVIRSFDLVKTMIDFSRMIDDLCHLNQISQQEAQALHSALNEAEKNNDFLYSIILFTAVGEKPL